MTALAWSFAADLLDPQRAEGDEYFPTARAAQIPPRLAWLVWLILAGRGFGKTRTGAEWLADRAIRQPGSRWAILAPTYADARDTCVEGESGLVSVLDRRGHHSVWNRSLGEVILPNTSRVKLFSADEPERLRGPQHHGAWCDEPASWRYGLDAWDQLQFGLRLGDHPQVVVTATPKPIPLIRQLAARTPPDVAITRGSTFDNADNLAPAALAELRNRYEGTRLGRQELYAELLEDVEGALWTLAAIDADRFNDVLSPGALARIVVAVDPAVTSYAGSDETGIVAAGVTHPGTCPTCGTIPPLERHGYVLDDRSGRYTPDQWALAAVNASDELGADRVVAEVNNGGDLVERVIRNVDPACSYRAVHASRGKRVRAEPIAALYEQRRIHHVGTFALLEDQLCSWTPDSKTSPDRMDALVWALTDLFEHGPGRKWTGATRLA